MDTQAASPPVVDTSTVIAAFVKLRDKRAELKKQYEEADAVLLEKQDKCKHWLMATMQQVGSDQLKGAVGIAYRQIKRRFNSKDWPSFWAYCLEHKRLDFLEKRVAQTAVKDFMEETGTLPPGIDVFQEYEVVIRRD